MNDNLVNKIRKLLSLSKSTNQHEAELALTKAREFAICNGIDLASISVEKIAEKYNSKDIKMGQGFPIAQRFVSFLLGRHFNVKVIYSGNRAWGRSVVLLGKESDIEIASYIQEYLNKAFLEIWREQREALNLPLKSRDSFMFGVYNGLNDKLTREAEVAKQAKMEEIKQDKGTEIAADIENKYAIILKTDKDKLDEFVGVTFPKLRSGQQRSLSLNSIDAQQAGYNAGAKIQIRAGIKDKTTHSLA